MKTDPKSSSSNKYLKYSGMALQLFALMGIGAWLGQKIDKKLATSTPYFTVILILLFTGGFFYILVKELSRKDES
ncbi:MAG TPA: AtpZ/AtpI family protein [Saprospiraceae bacterium]|nr:AtpZ/AtpI family protein [Saprospiraceae bacterium]